MRKAAFLLIAAVAASSAYAQFAPLSANTAYHEGIVICAQYPSGWTVSGMDLGGLSICFISPRADIMDPSDLMDVSQLLKDGEPFAILGTFTPEAALAFGKDLGDGENPLSGLYESLGEELERQTTENISTAGSMGTLVTGRWGDEGQTVAYVASAKTVQGAVAFFIGVSSFEDADAYRDAFALMHGSFTLKGGPEGIPSGNQGFNRLASGRLGVDYPSDWHPLWLETKGMKAALFTVTPLTFETFQDMDFPPTGNEESIAMIAIASGEELEGISGMTPDEILGNLSQGLGTKLQTLEKGSVTLNGLDGRRTGVSFTDKDGGKKNAFACAAVDPSGVMYMFVGISPAQRYTADKKKFEAMVRSFSFRP
jgi:hypothetical protein